MAAPAAMYCTILTLALPALKVSAITHKVDSSDLHGAARLGSQLQADSHALHPRGFATGPDKSAVNLSATASLPGSAVSSSSTVPTPVTAEPTLPVAATLKKPSFWFRWRDSRHWWSGRKSQEDPTWISRVQHWHHQGYHQKTGILHFFSSAVAFEWMAFGIALLIFLVLSLVLFDWPSKRPFHALALFIWLAAAAAYCMVIWLHLGHDTGADWLIGYFLEFVFSIENVFIYHIVVEAFQVPRKPAQKALFVVVCCQAVFQMVFFMGLANGLESIRILPYVLGLWLLYVGVQSLREGDHTTFNGKESMVFRTCQSILGGRLSPTYMEDKVFFWEDGRMRATLLLPATACLLLVDFVMEVDVTLTKIEEIENHYIGFTSSVAAAFAVPELFFVARDLFKRFVLLKYGVSFVLLFFGSELLMCSWIHIPDMVGMIIIAAVMVFCAVLSKALGYETRTADDSEQEAQEKDEVEDDRPVAKEKKDIPVEVEPDRLPSMS